MVEVGFDSAFVGSSNSFPQLSRLDRIRVYRSEENQISFTLCTDVGEGSGGLTTMKKVLLLFDTSAQGDPKRLSHLPQFIF